MTYGKFGFFICCINDISCWDPLKSCDILHWWGIILELGGKFVMPYRNWLRGSDIGGMTRHVIKGCGCWNNVAVIFKNPLSLAAWLWLYSFKKSNTSLEEVSAPSVLRVLMASFISFKKLSVCPLAGVGTCFLFAFGFSLEDLEEEPWLVSSWQTSSSLHSSGLSSSSLVLEAFLPVSIACWCWQLSIELTIGNNLPDQLPNSLSSWNA